MSMLRLSSHILPKVLHHEKTNYIVIKSFVNNPSSSSNNWKDIRAMRILNIAEKNDAAKNISNIIARGGSQRREGFSKFNKIYEFNTQIWNQNCQMIMTSVSGHLLTYEFIGAYRKWNGCHPLSLFDAPVAKQCPEDSLKIKQTLEREIRSCNALIIWTDCDREGENIGFEIINVCQAVKPNIRVYRAKFSEITYQSISRALATLTEPNKAVSDAVDVRSELDLRIGAAFTRFQTLRLQKVFPQTLGDRLISYGSCQFPTLGFVVERFLAIERFVSEPYWKLRVMDIRDGIHVEFKWSRNRLFEKLPCELYLDICQENPNATVEKVTSKPKIKWRPLPLDTVELEKQGSRKLGLSAKEAMQIAEKLYTQGLISYPRTETNIFPKELNLQPIVEQQEQSNNWGDFAQQVLQDGINPRQGKKSDQAHPPIYPIKFVDNLHGNEAKVYEFVVRHFLACVAKNAEGRETVVEIDIAGEKFVANGLQIIAKNYLDIYIYEKWYAKEIHAYEQGQIFIPTSIEIIEEKTSPPSLLTEADLIALMDKHGIGTDATHAEHIETIKSREYVGVINNQFLMPGKLGIGLVMGYDKMGFHMSKPNLRAELENDLKLICERQKDPKQVLRDQIAKYRNVFERALEQANLLDRALGEYLNDDPVVTPDIEITSIQTEVVILKCPKCGCDMTLKDRRQQEGKFISCMNFPTCNNAIWLSLAVENVEVQDEVCNRCPGGMKKLKFKFKPGAMPRFGNEYTTCIGGCDQLFNEMMDIRLSTVRKMNSSNDSGFGSTQSGNNQNNSQSQGARGNRISNPSRIGMVASTSNISGRPSEQIWGNIDSDEAVLCHCHENAIILTVKKEGPNKGRQFYKCKKPQGGGCNFFLWANDRNSGLPVASNSSLSGGSSWNNSISYGKGRRPVGGNSEVSKKSRVTGNKRKCGICGTEGHTRKTCPQNAMD